MRKCEIQTTNNTNKVRVYRDNLQIRYTRIEKKVEEKCTNYSDLKYEIARIWKMKKVDVIPVVIETLGTVTKNFDKWLERLELDLTVEMLQRPSLLGTARIIRKVLDIK